MRSILVLVAITLSFSSMASVGFSSPIDTQTKTVNDLFGVPATEVEAITIESLFCGAMSSPVVLTNELTLEVEGLYSFEFVNSSNSAESTIRDIRNKGDPCTVN